MKSTKIQLTLTKSMQISSGIYSFYFASQPQFLFQAGQYLQLTLSHAHDDLGTTRFFSIASSPDEKEIMLTIKKGKSSFKEILFSLKPGDTIEAFGPMGKFTLED